ncbi:MAG: LL-diaminopimelate aminotransferase [Candidatus Hydrogenedentota bacterium]
MQIEISKRLQKLPPYLFAEIDALKESVKKKGKDIISLGIGDPDGATPEHIIKSMAKAIRNPEHHHYPSYEGMEIYRKAVALWYKRRFNVDLDPQREILSLIGSKEGIAHIHIAFVNPGDIVLEPDPAYPVYHIGTVFTDGESYTVPLLEKNNFLPDLSSIPTDIAKRAKLFFINYPNNPTGAKADLRFYNDVVRFAKDYNVIICADTAYSEIYDNEPPPSFLNAREARDVGVEFHSLSKTYNMTGWRIGFVCGNADIISGLGKVKTNVDSGVFQAVQEAAITALGSSKQSVKKIRQTFTKRRKLFKQGLDELGFRYFDTDTTFYIWVKVPGDIDSKTFAMRVLEETGVVVTPGIGFGRYGEGYFRVALTVKEQELKEALQRIKKIK